MARQGGLYAARPKALLEALLPQFPDLTLQIVKWCAAGRRSGGQSTVDRLLGRWSAGLLPCWCAGRRR